MNRLRLCPLAMFIVLGVMARPASARSGGTPIFDSADFTAPSLTIIDYSNSPAGALPESTSVTGQYAAVGAIHDGSTTTPPGPTGMSSASGLPGLESDADDPDSNLPITINFTTPVNQVGAYFLMGGSDNSVTLAAMRTDNTVIDSVTVLPADMPLHPGPFNFNEGFVGLIVSEHIAAVSFTPNDPFGNVGNPFVIDDLHFGVPEPSSLLLISLAVFGWAGTNRRW